MPKKIKILLLVVVLCIACFGSTVYASETETGTEEQEAGEKLYDDMDQEVKDQLDGLQNAADELDIPFIDKISEGGWGYVYNIYARFSELLWVVVVLFHIAGVLIYLCARKNKRLKRFGFYGVGIAIPLIMIVVVYGLPFLIRFVQGGITL